MNTRFVCTAFAAGFMTLATLTLAGCGGGDDDDTATSAPPPPSTPDTPITASGPKVVLVGVDGLTYDALRDASARGAAPALSALHTGPAFAGGVAGTPTQQPTLNGPGWASILTGTWVNRHGIASDYAEQQYQTATLFDLIKRGDSQRKTAAVYSWSDLGTMLQSQTYQGALDSSVDCNGVDSCVTTQAEALIKAGYDAIALQYRGPMLVAANAGTDSDAYRAAVTTADRQIASIAAALAQRRLRAPAEKWLLAVTTSAGLGVRGTVDGLPDGVNRTVFIGLDQPVNDVLQAGLKTSPEHWASLADITPTILNHFGALPKPGDAPLDGAALIGPGGVREFSAMPTEDRHAISLTWRLPAGNSDPIVVMRDGVTIATLDATAVSHTDDTLVFEKDGLYKLNYTVLANQQPVSQRAQIDYVKPVELGAGLLNGLNLFYSFDSGPIDRFGASTLAPFKDGQTGTDIDDAFGSHALAIDTTLSGYALRPVVSAASLPAFTIAFWYRSDATASDMPILANKDYGSGANAGLAIAQFGSELRFNLGSGGKRDDINGMTFSKNQWVLVAMSVDTQARKFSAFIFDPAFGLRKREGQSIVNTDVTKLSPRAVFGLNEDALGTYTSRYGKSGVMHFNDLAMWSRVLTQDELNQIYASGKSLSTLAP